MRQRTLQPTTTPEAASPTRAEVEARLLPILEVARGLGFLGPGALVPHVGHALGFAETATTVIRAESDSPGKRCGSACYVAHRCLDLGSGAGLPGLVLALWWPSSTWVLLDAGVRRTAFLSEAVDRLELAGRVEVVTGRAEELGHESGWRASRELVTARGFGPPAVTAECAASFVAVGGRTVVSEPPGGRPARWPKAGLARLGMVPGPVVTTADGTYQVLDQDGLCPAPLPRRTGIPAKRPLFTAD